MPSVIFFGSFQHYSTFILKALHQNKDIKVLAVVTTPPPSPPFPERFSQDVLGFSQKKELPVLTPSSLSQPSRSVLEGLKRPDYFIVAGYGKILPSSWLKYPTIAPLNLHFSLLPKYRGANPAEWAILRGETQTGVSLIKMQTNIDTGPILSQKKLAITKTDTRESLYQKLYLLAAKLIVEFLSQSLENCKLKIENSLAQPEKSPTPYAVRLTRPDGFIPWPLIQKSLQGQNVPFKSRPGIFSLKIENWSLIIERATRALLGFPGVWTKIPTKKGERRLKILSTHLQNKNLVIDQVQLEGLNPSYFNQIKNQIRYPKCSIVNIQLGTGPKSKSKKPVADKCQERRENCKPTQDIGCPVHT